MRVCFIIGLLMCGECIARPVEIVTIDSPRSEVLRRKSEPIGQGEMILAQEIIEKLHKGLGPYLPAAGLAAPQIGIGKAVFIYSYDRDPAHLEGVINPTYIPLSEERVLGWEGCFSVILSEPKLVKIGRYKSIQVSYTDFNGNRVEKVLENFAAKVFQHEWDHLEGIVCLDHPDAVVKTFETQEEMSRFFQEVKKADAH